MTNDPSAWLAWIRSANPFLINRVDGLSLPEVDVQQIHQRDYAALVRMAEQARSQNHGLGAIVGGEAGVGKSHLLLRLWQWADSPRVGTSADTPGGSQACFVYLHNLSPAASTLPRYILRCVIGFLTRGKRSNLHLTPLYSLVHAFIEAAKRVPGAPPALEPAYHALIDRLIEQNPARLGLLDRTVFQVLFRFWQAAPLAAAQELAWLAVQWLGGEYLDPGEARKLGLRPAGSDEEAVRLVDDQYIKQVFCVLTQMALYCRQPFLLCFDQVENLDADRLDALCRFLHALLDSCGNLLVVFAGVQDRLLDLLDQGRIARSSWDRLAMETVDLKRVTRQQAGDILAARLDRFFAPYSYEPGLQTLRQQDRLFPLGSDWWTQRTAYLNHVRPRDAVTWAYRRFRQQQEALENAATPEAWLAHWAEGVPEPTPTPVVDPLPNFLAGQVREKLAEFRGLLEERPHALPPSGENLIGLAGAVLQQWLTLHPGGLTLDVAPNEKAEGCDLIVRDGDGRSRVGLFALVTSSAVAAAARLRRLLQAPRLPERVLLLADERQLPKLGERGSQYLEQLRTRNLTEVALSFARYAELDALETVAGLARAGDLEAVLPDGRTHRLSEAEVLKSLDELGCYRQHPLIQAAFPGGGPA
jgi:hypothetical protein